jgi:hypothetical protein
MKPDFPTYSDNVIYWFAQGKRVEGNYRNEYHIEASSLQEAKERMCAILGLDEEETRDIIRFNNNPAQNWDNYDYAECGDWYEEDVRDGFNPSTDHGWRVILNLDDGRVFYRYVE